MKEVIPENLELELPPKEGLPTPQFDEMAIAEARPVEPLLQRPRSTFRILRAPRTLAMLIIATVVLMAIAGLSIGTNSHVDPVQPASAEVESQADSQPSENPAVSQPAVERRALVSGRNRRSTRSYHHLFESRDYGSGDGKPVARKVGEIRH